MCKIKSSSKPSGLLLFCYLFDIIYYLLSSPLISSDKTNSLQPSPGHFVRRRLWCYFLLDLKLKIGRAMHSPTRFPQVVIFSLLSVIYYLYWPHPPQAVSLPLWREGLYTKWGSTIKVEVSFPISPFKVRMIDNGSIAFQNGRFAWTVYWNLLYERRDMLGRYIDTDNADCSSFSYSGTTCDIMS